MTEKEKMLRRLLYDANYDEELLAERMRAKDLCYTFNQLRPSEAAEQERILRSLLGKTGASFSILPPFWCDYGYNIEIGDHFFGQPQLRDPGRQ